MDILIIHASKYGNGLKCSKYMKALAFKLGHTAKVVSIEDEAPEKMMPTDLFIIVSPITIRRPPRRMKKFLKKINPTIPFMNYSVVLTGVDEKPRGMKRIDKILIKKNWVKVNDGIKVRVEDIEGPLEKNYIGKLDRFLKDVFGILHTKE